MSNDLRGTPYPPPAAAGKSVIPVVLGALGSAVAVLGPVVVFEASRHSGWWSVTGISSMAMCGAVALVLGIIAIVRSKGVVASAPARVLGIISTVAGALIVGLLSAIMVFMLLLTASM